MADEPDALHRPFRPRATRLVATTLAVLVPAGALVLVVLLAVQVPGWQPWPERIGFLVFGLAVSWFLMRHAGVRADPDDDGLRVRNLLVVRHLTWAQIVSVRFGGDRPWVQLDLADGTVHPVMAVQQADGAYARAEAQRLASLVAWHSRTEHDR